VSEEPVSGRLHSNGCEAAVQVWFVDGHGAVPAGDGIGVQPGQGQFVRGGKQHDRLGRAAPVVDQMGLCRCEVERGVRKLGGLVARRKVGARDEVQARKAALVVRHEARLADVGKRCGLATRSEAGDEMAENRSAGSVASS
jgi:hypothetical protein